MMDFLLSLLCLVGVVIAMYVAIWTGVHILEFMSWILPL